MNHVIGPLLDVYFPEGSGVQIISEPGSYYVSSAFTLAVNIIAKKVVENDKLSSGGKLQSLYLMFWIKLPPCDFYPKNRGFVVISSAFLLSQDNLPCILIQGQSVL